MRSSEEIKRELRELQQRCRGLEDVRTVAAYNEAIRQAERNEAIQAQRRQQDRVQKILDGSL